MSLCLLVDDDGRLFDADGLEARSRLAFEGSTSELVKRAVAGHGWVGLAHHATHIEIFLPTRDAAPRAVQLAIYLVMATLVRQLFLVIAGPRWRPLPRQS